MISIKPTIDFKPSCPVCKVKTKASNLVWQGIHVGLNHSCPNCKRQLVSDLPIGQATMTPFTVCPNKNEVFGEEGPAKTWFGKPFLNSLRKPNQSEVELVVTVLKKRPKAIIINCLDYLYGHTLLKLLNTQRYLNQRKYGVIVIIPHFLSWLVPEGVAEIWTVALPLSKSQLYYPKLDAQIQENLQRFNEIQLSEAYSHPLDFNITRFTNQAIHSFESDTYRITFIWREDRPWNNHLYASVAARKLNVLQPFIAHQRHKVISLFSKIRRELPNAQLTVAGLGTSGTFPSWIDDQRVATFTSAIEQQLAAIYAESRVVVGVHGSNLLLPSAQAGGAISLIPDDRLGNYAEDLLYQQPLALSDPRLSAFFYRYLPISTSVKTLASQITSMVKTRVKVERIFTTQAKREAAGGKL